MCFGGLLEQQSSFQELNTSTCERRYSALLSLGFSRSAPTPPRISRKLIVPLIIIEIPKAFELSKRDRRNLKMNRAQKAHNYTIYFISG